MEAEVEAGVKSLQAKSAVGRDGVSVPELRKVPVPVLTLIFNNWFAYCTVPRELQLARTAFIPKKAKPEGPSDYRPITVSPVLYRLFAQLLLARLSRRNHFHKYQAGFSEGNSTSTNLLLLQALMRAMKMKRRPLFAASLDCKEGF